MRFFAELKLTKEKGRDVEGKLLLGYWPYRDTVFDVRVQGDEVSITGKGFEMKLKEIPQDKELKTPEEKAMARIFSEVVFGPIQTLYERSIKNPPDQLENIAASQARLDSKRSVFITSRNEEEGKEYTALIGSEPSNQEKEYMDKYEAEKIQYRDDFFKIS